MPPLLGVHIASPLVRAIAAREVIAGVGPQRKRRGDIPNQHSSPAASSEQIRRRMAATKRRDTQPELALRSALFGLGLRFRVDHKVAGLRGRVDIAFPADHLAVFVETDASGTPARSMVPLRSGTVTGGSTSWTANRRRDADTDRALSEVGWRSTAFLGTRRSARRCGPGARIPCDVTNRRRGLSRDAPWKVAWARLRAQAPTESDR